MALCAVAPTCAHRRAAADTDLVGGCGGAGGGGCGGSSRERPPPINTHAGSPSAIPASRARRRNRGQIHTAGGCMHYTVGAGC